MIKLSDVYLNRCYVYACIYCLIGVLDRLDYGASFIIDRFIAIMKSPGGYAHYLLQDAVNENTVKQLLFSVYKHLTFIVSIVSGVATFCLSLFSVNDASISEAQYPLEILGGILIAIIIIYIFVLSSVSGRDFTGSISENKSLFFETIKYRNFNARAKGRLKAVFMKNFSTLIIIILAYVSIYPLYALHVKAVNQEKAVNVEQHSNSETNSSVQPKQ